MELNKIKFTIRHIKEPEKLYTGIMVPAHFLVKAINLIYPRSCNRYAVNLGADDGIACNDPVYPLYKEGWSGLAIDGREQPNLFNNIPQASVRKYDNTVITPDNIVNMLKNNYCPKDPDMLKIDIDGYDLSIVETILKAGYTPKIIQVEVNPDFPPPIEFYVMYDSKYCCVDKNNKFTGFYGTSIAALDYVGRQYGYRMANLDFVTEWTHDAVLVHNDYLDVASKVYERDCALVTLRDLFFEQPPGYSHFQEYDIDAFVWRYRNDYDTLIAEMSDVCIYSNTRKHEGYQVPFFIGRRESKLAQIIKDRRLKK
jgi:hypothetical protein